VQSQLVVQVILPQLLAQAAVVVVLQEMVLLPQILQLVVQVDLVEAAVAQVVQQAAQAAQEYFTFSTREQL
jgi:hypothetical protein